MKNFKVLLCLIFGITLSNAALAKTEQVALKNKITFGEEAIIFQTTKGEVILNMYALPEKVLKQMKPFKKGQCLQIQSKNGFFNDTNDGQYIQSIRLCPKK